MDTLELTPPKNECWAQVNRILQSAGFGSAEILRGLLSHLAQVSIEEPGRHLKEYEIGVDALGRGSNFDPRIDSGVRVHSARLRTKLSEYYHGPGASDPIEIVLPKGAYLLMYRYRVNFPDATPSAPVSFSEVESGFAAPSKPWFTWILGGLLLVAATSAFWKWHDRPTAVSPSLSKFWGTFDSRPQETLLIFSNPRFVGSVSSGSESGLRYVPPGLSVSAEEMNDRYTGIGEAMALHELTKLFDRLDYPFRAKRSSLVVWDEARSRNLIFIGGPNVNDSLAELPKLREFRFKSIDDQPSAGQGGIVNIHPSPGEEQIYLNSGPPYGMDYAVIGLVPSMSSDRRALILAGRTTFGTQGATEFLMHEKNISSLFKQLGVSAASSADVPFFEALLRVKISGGVPVQPELVLIKLRD